MSDPQAILGPRLLVTIDTECDKAPDWRVSSPMSFVNITQAVPERLHPLFMRYGIRPTYLISPEVLLHPESVAVLRQLPNAELTTHLHGEFITPQLKQADMSGASTADMQWEYGEALERAKLGTLTELFRQQIGYQPLSFRAGRFGAGPHTGKILRDLGYVIDSSVTPHVRWTSSEGVKYPDYTDYAEMPYWLGEQGNLAQAGQGGLLELPVTVLAPRGDGAPRWFRPWYADAAMLREVFEAVLAQPPVNGVQRPLVMMFHSVEVLAGASPYPQTEADVQAYLDLLAGVFELAREYAVPACTMAEYHAAYTAHTQARPASVVAPAPRDVDSWLPLSTAQVHALFDRHGVQPWFKYIYSQRATRWDVLQPCHWVAAHVPRHASVLSVGAGVGLNLLWFGQQGFSDLCGTDVDPRAVAAGRELAAMSGLPVRLQVEDAMQGQAFAGRQFGVIEALNCTMYMPAFDLARFVALYAARLLPEGVLIFDVIDQSYNLMPDQQYHSADLTLPPEQRRPSEYLHRFSQAAVRAVLAQHGLEELGYFHQPSAIPRVVYVARRRAVQPEGSAVA